MRTQFVGLGVMMVVGAAALTSGARAEGGRPSRQALEAMGLGSLNVISDDEAMAVRGQGYQGGGGIQSYVRVSGSSFATYDAGNGSGSHSQNQYFAEGNHKAAGTNSSYAGVADIWVGSKGGNGGGGEYGNKPPKNGGYGGGGMNGGGGYGGGQPSVKIHATVFFAGGSSTAHAW